MVIYFNNREYSSYWDLFQSGSFRTDQLSVLICCVIRPSIPEIQPKFPSSSFARFRVSFAPQLTLAAALLVLFFLPL